MRGKKGSRYEGGHRVPFYIRWPAGGVRPDREIRELISHVDLLPTFIDFCGLERPGDVRLDGMSVAPLLRGGDGELPDREIFVQNVQGTTPPPKWRNAVLTRRWRLIDGRELYDVQADPGQEHDVAAEHADVVRRLREAHEEHWEQVEPTLSEYCPISLGSDQENPTRLNAMDLTGDVAWHQSHIRKALEASGGWAVDVEQAGTYRLSLRRWPEEIDLGVYEGCGSEDCVLIRPTHARVRIGTIDQTVEVPPDAKGVTFRVDLPAGRAHLDAEFINAGGRDAPQSAYYVYAERVE
jgi:hypothetical protein